MHKNNKRGGGVEKKTKKCNCRLLKNLILNDILRMDLAQKGISPDEIYKYLQPGWQKLNLKVFMPDINKHAHAKPKFSFHTFIKFNFDFHRAEGEARPKELIFD